MSHAEALQTLHPAVGATEAIVEFVNELRHAALTDEVRHYARRHLLDTVGVMIAGAGGEVATRAEAVLAAVRPAGRIPVPGRARRADLIDAAFLGGTAAHGIELDDGFRQGSVHPGCVVVPAVLALGYDRRITGAALIEARGRRLRGRDRDRARVPSRPAPARIPSGGRGRRVRLGHGGRQAAPALGRATCQRARDRRLERGRTVRVRQRRRRHQAPARRPRLARRPAGRAAGGARGRRPARCDRGARRLHAGFRLRPRRQGARYHAAAGRAVRHHRLLHQALSVLPAHPARGRGADRPAQR